MGVKIRVSYQDPQELAHVLRLLRPIVKKCKISGNREGSFRKAYLEVEQVTGKNQMGSAEARVKLEKSENEAVRKP